jgi:hypothetical protein
MHGHMQAPDMTKQLTIPDSGRLGREYRTMHHMVAIYCRDHHGSGSGTPCEDCGQFLEYAARRLRKCPYGEDKPTCTNCPIHCYKRDPRAFARTVMRYAGPRMMWRHPWLAVMHLIDGRRSVEHPRELRRRRTPDR